MFCPHRVFPLHPCLVYCVATHYPSQLAAPSVRVAATHAARPDPSTSKRACRCVACSMDCVASPNTQLPWLRTTTPVLDQSVLHRLLPQVHMVGFVKILTSLMLQTHNQHKGVLVSVCSTQQRLCERHHSDIMVTS